MKEDPFEKALKAAQRKGSAGGVRREVRSLRTAFTRSYTGPSSAEVLRLAAEDIERMEAGGVVAVQSMALYEYYDDEPFGVELLVTYDG